MSVSIALLLSTLCFGQTDSETNGGNKRYHGDGIDNVLQYVPTVAVFGLKALEKTLDYFCGFVCNECWSDVCFEAFYT